MNIDQVYTSNSNYLKASDIPAGVQAKVVIASCEMVEMDNNGKKENKIALNFQGKDKQLLLNKTNAGSISHVYGPDTDNWIGKEINMFSTKVDYAGQMVDAIRLNVFKPNQDGMDDDIPF